MSRMFCVWHYPPASLDTPGFYEQFGSDGNQLMPGFDQREMGGDVDLRYMGRAHVVFDMEELVRYVYFREQLYAYAQRPAADP